MILSKDRRSQLTLSLCAFLLLLVGTAKVAAAQGDKNEEKAECVIFEVRASNDAGGVDPALAPLQKKLQKPPFSAWKTFKVVKKHTKTAVLMTALEVKLATGGKLSLLYRDRSDTKGKKTRLRFGFTLDDANGKRKADMTIKADSGDYTLVGRDANKDGSSHILAISCTAK